MPLQSAWADNYVSLVGLYQPKTVNIALQKALYKLISQGFNYLGTVAARGSQTLVNLFDSAVLRLTLRTSPSPTSVPQVPTGSPGPRRKHGPDSPTSTAAMAWAPLQIPANATGMAFDFIVVGDPVDDGLVWNRGHKPVFTPGEIHPDEHHLGKPFD